MWRNLSRNELRSALTGGSIALAVALVCALRYFEKIRAMPGVVAAASWTWFGGAYARGSGPHRFPRRRCATSSSGVRRDPAPLLPPYYTLWYHAAAPARSDPA